MARATTAKTAVKTTTRKTAAKPKTTRPAAKTVAPSTVDAVGAAAASVVAPEPTVVGEMKPVVTVREMKKKELMDAVVRRSGTRKKLAKPVVEAMLAVLGETLADGVELNAQPLGKLKINRAKKIRGGQIIMLKLRVSDAAPKPAVGADMGAGEKVDDDDTQGLADLGE